MGERPETQSPATPSAQLITTNGNGTAHAGDEEVHDDDSVDGSCDASGGLRPSSQTTNHKSIPQPSNHTQRNGIHTPTEELVGGKDKTNMSLDLKPTNPTSLTPGSLNSPDTTTKLDAAAKEQMMYTSASIFFSKFVFGVVFVQLTASRLISNS